jgi:hypothetical protein
VGLAFIRFTPAIALAGFGLSWENCCFPNRRENLEFLINSEFPTVLAFFMG